MKVPVTEVKLNEAMGCVAFGSAEGTLRVEAFRKGQVCVCVCVCYEEHSVPTLCTHTMQTHTHTHMYAHACMHTHAHARTWSL